MIAAFKQIVQPAYLETSESIAHVVFNEMAPQRQIAVLQGEVSGPYCQWAKTLPTQFEIRPMAHQSGSAAAAETLITEPCYWTPQQPVLYRIEFKIDFKNGSQRTLNLPFGLQRWRADGPHVRRDGERVVLRGAEFVDAGSDVERHAALTTARDNRMALIPIGPMYEMYRDASQFGVEIVADLRRPGEDFLTGALREIAWHPAIVAALVDNTATDERPPAMIPRVAAAVSSHGIDARLSMPPWTNAFACELRPGERPSPWLAECGKPVIAIRRGLTYADLHEARAACDRLQAELAPQFNLAGYFVAP